MICVKSVLQEFWYSQISFMNNRLEAKYTIKSNSWSSHMPQKKSIRYSESIQLYWLKGTQGKINCCVRVTLKCYVNPDWGQLSTNKSWVLVTIDQSLSGLCFKSNGMSTKSWCEWRWNVKHSNHRVLAHWSSVFNGLSPKTGRVEGKKGWDREWILNTNRTEQSARCLMGGDLGLNDMTKSLIDPKLHIFIYIAFLLVNTEPN